MNLSLCQLEDILKLHNRYFLDKKVIENIEEMNENDRYDIKVIEDNGSVIAYIIILDNIDSYDLFEIAVHEEYRNKGLASRLMDMLPSDKETLLEVDEKNENAIKLYEKYGFYKIFTRKEYYLDGSNASIMRNRR